MNSLRAWYIGVPLGALTAFAVIAYLVSSNAVYAPIPAGSPNLQITTTLVCLVNSPDKMDGWVTFTVNADTTATGVGSATAQLYIAARYTPHTYTGTHLTDQQSTLIIQSETVSNPGNPVTAFASGTGSISVPAHEDTDHTSYLRFLDLVGATPVERARVQVPSCEG